ncbi:endonuclease/exonuclease/phosphatase family protein [Pelagibacterium halotolerans]|uniref:endonuclease/exonuclease/phosphatase family protein n=1 Tax=Pelagibacterium halotolerans TaxID=531813 RepID=UPI00384C2512
MNILTGTIRGLVAAGYAAICCIFAGAAIGAALGFAHPVLDLFNHAQPVLFYGSIVLMLFAPLFVRGAVLKPFVLTVAATGLVASSLVYIPEAVRGFAPRPPVPGGDRPVYTVMTFNVFGRNREPERLVASILEADPDILALQEYSRDMRQEIHRTLAEHYPNFQYCAGGERAFVGLYAKFPFEPLNEDACSSTIMSPDRTARIIVRFEPEGGPPFSVATTHHDWPAPITRQAVQFETLAEALSTVEPPVLLVGDFNSTPWSYALRNFVAVAGVTRHTYNIPTFPQIWHYLGDWRPIPALLPIDHVMTRGGIAIHSITTGDPAGSDHKPLLVTFSVGDPA